MATKEQLKGNKKLSIFIDCPLQRKSEKGNIDVFQIGVWKDEYIWDKLINRSDLDNTYAVIRNTIPFHSDWNWLMKVVDEIEAIKYNEKYVVVDIVSTGCYIYCKGNESLSINLFTDSKTDAVWNACVQFVDWHNKNCNKTHSIYV